MRATVPYNTVYRLNYKINGKWLIFTISIIKRLVPIFNTALYESLGRLATSALNFSVIDVLCTGQLKRSLRSGSSMKASRMQYVLL